MKERSYKSLKLAVYAEDDSICFSIIETATTVPTQQAQIAVSKQDALRIVETLIMLCKGGGYEY